VAVIQQLYINVEVTCNHPTKQPLCQKYSIGRKTAAHLLEQMKETIGLVLLIQPVITLKMKQVKF